jgi:hypothetical protein
VTAFILYALPQQTGETTIRDYIPNPPNPERDPRNDYRYYEDADSGRGVTLVVGILVAIALATSSMFFAGTPRDGTNQAQLPVQERMMTQPAAVPTPATPANPQR